MGGDKYADFVKFQLFVSIHAPVWGATFLFFTTRILDWFQSTPPYGGRLGTCGMTPVTSQFQSTPPYGGRRATVHLVEVTLKFQSTPPYGGRRGFK